ncbi:MAG: sensor histidine kinase [Acidobacteriota bacterium]
MSRHGTVTGADERDATSAPSAVPPAAAELIGRIGWLIRLRWVAVVGVAAFLEIARRLFPVHLELGPLYLVLAGLAGFNLVVTLLVRRLRSSEPGPPRGWAMRLSRLLVPRPLWGLEGEGRTLRAAALANGQIAIDLLALALLLHFSGGIENPFVFFFVFHTIIASILLSRRATYLQAGVAVVLIAAVAVGEASGFLRHFPLDGVWREGAYRQPALVAAQLFVVAATLFLSAYMGSTIAAHLRNRERDVVQLSRQLGDKADRLEEAYRRLHDIEQAKSRYMRKVAHELRSPLATVQTALSAVLEGLAGELPERPRELVERARRRADELARLTEDLLALARAREAHEMAEWEEVDLGSLIADAVHEAMPTAADKGVAVVVELPTSPALVSVDRRALQQLLGNLIGNALRYTPTGGTVTVRGERTGDEVRIEVGDTGIGIPAEDLPRVFDEFFRSANARHMAPDGTGLGLAIVRAVAEQHGGGVEIASTVGEGTRITVRIVCRKSLSRNPGERIEHP